jgi:hypothetical protein
LQEDITALMDSLAEHEVYIEKEGRVLDDDEKAVPDTLSVGMAALTHGSSSTPLDEFNEQFEVLRRRRGLTPVHDLLGLVNTSGLSAPTPAPAPTPSTPDIAATDADDDDYADMPGLQVPDSEDLFAESPTLTRLDEGDVEFDMDDVPEWYLDDGDRSDSDEDEDDA